MVTPPPVRVVGPRVRDRRPFGGSRLVRAIGVGGRLKAATRGNQVVLEQPTAGALAGVTALSPRPLGWADTHAWLRLYLKGILEK